MADPAKAARMRAYLLNQFDFLGIPTPERRAAIRDLIVRPPAGPDALIAASEQLWQLPEREFRYAAIDLLKRHERLLGPGHLDKLQALALDAPWWETVDGLAGVVGAILKVNPHAQDVMDEWLVHPSLWVRRVAMLHQLGWRTQTDATRLARYALVLGGEKEFFIRKAIGWALRDYARWDANFVKEFVRLNREKLSPLSIREACKRIGKIGDLSGDV